MNHFEFGFFDELQKVAAGLMDAANFGNRATQPDFKTYANKKAMEQLISSGLKSGNFRVVKGSRKHPNGILKR